MQSVYVGMGRFQRETRSLGAGGSVGRSVGESNALLVSEDRNVSSQEIKSI
jgi:hypothetical protein